MPTYIIRPRPWQKRPLSTVYCIRMTALRRVIIAAIVFFAPICAFAAAPGDLVKIPCPGGEAADHPCRAVYYYGGDGRRHAFPNERNYFSWYPNFSAVKIVSESGMAAIPLGENVTYRPGSTLVKFPSEGKVYAVASDRALRWVTSESIAVDIAGLNWTKKVDDISETFFGDYSFGANITAASGYNASSELAGAPNIDAALPDSYRTLKVDTDRGTFDVQVISLRKDRFSMITAVAAPTPDCIDNCATEPLADYAAAAGALIGVHGTYFCPPDYADCQGKTNTFNPPVFRTSDRVMFQPFGLQVHKGPMIAYMSDGKYVFLRLATDSGGSVSALESHQSALLVAAISNYPALMQGGQVVVDNDPLLEDIQRTKKSTRAGIGLDEKRLLIVVAKNATVPDLASVFAALGAKDALNLDGGGSTALMYGGAYKAGPGRTLPNAVLFKAR